MITATHKRTGKTSTVTKEQREALQKHGSFRGVYSFTEDKKGVVPVPKSKKKNEDS